MFQTLNPGTWLTKSDQSPPAGSNTHISAIYAEDATTPLLPFRKPSDVARPNDPFQWWTSNDVRNWSKLGYDYPGIKFIEDPGAGDLSKQAVTVMQQANTVVTRTYAWMTTSNSAKPAPAKGLFDAFPNIAGNPIYPKPLFIDDTLAAIPRPIQPPKVANTTAIPPQSSTTTTSSTATAIIDQAAPVSDEIVPTASSQASPPPPPASATGAPPPGGPSSSRTVRPPSTSGTRPPPPRGPAALSTGPRVTATGSSGAFTTPTTSTASSTINQMNPEDLHEPVTYNKKSLFDPSWLPEAPLDRTNVSNSVSYPVTQSTLEESKQSTAAVEVTSPFVHMKIAPPMSGKNMYKQWDASVVLEK
jgi:hypothetical protein